ncbi:esterase-like activity of phytase-domain-containing protein [Hysterangium stoloniferum]|nr:esterase-like activity of phytase-domain-containing protein [Hysterangium stoloniferum]
MLTILGLISYSILLNSAVRVLAFPATKSLGSALEPDPANFVNVTFDNKVFINKGLVAFGLIPANFRESTGDTFGGVGSAIALKRGSWKKLDNGSFSGSFVVQPDRGFNVVNTIDYQARQHIVSFTLSPYYDTTPLSFNDSQKTLSLTYLSTLLYTERQGKRTTGLDALAVRAAERVAFVEDPQEPIANTTFDRISFDSEGLVLNKDGSFWTSDEYGPYVHLLSASGSLIRSIQPPKAILPFHTVPGVANPVLNFTADTDPTTGRSGNQGFEGLTANAENTRLYVLLQSATIQDGGSSKSTSRFTRFLVYDTSIELFPPLLLAEYVVPLPQKSNGNTNAQSEVHFLTDTQFLILARDANGNGGGVGSEKSSFKDVDLFDISQATNIAHSKFDDPANPIAINGTLVPGITPALYQSFVDMIDPTQLARFGLHNGKPIDPTLINSKWESLALAPAEDPKFPEDYFLFSVSDNDFITTDGISGGVPYNAGADEDSQFLVWRVTLPNVAKNSVKKSIGL